MKIPRVSLSGICSEPAKDDFGRSSSPMSRSPAAASGLIVGIPDEVMSDGVCLVIEAGPSGSPKSLEITPSLATLICQSREL